MKLYVSIIQFDIFSGIKQIYFLDIVFWKIQETVL